MESHFKRNILTPLKKNKDFSNVCILYVSFETVFYNNTCFLTCYSVYSTNSLYKRTKIISNVSSSELLIESSNLLINDFKNFIFQLDLQHLILFFCNLEKLDLSFLFQNFERNTSFNYSMELLERNNKILKIIFKNPDLKKIIEFRDLALILQDELLTASSDLVFMDDYLSLDYTRNNLKLVEFCQNQAQTAFILATELFVFLRDILKIEPLDSLTISHLALRLFRQNFYDSKLYPIEISRSLKDSFIRQAYKGGIVEVYKPYLLNGYHYDINSLYPYVMKKYLFPIGVGKWIKGENICLENFFGFIQVKVSTPIDLYIPFLTKYDDKLGLISPVGTWGDVYFSEEIKYAIKLGYSFTFIKGISYVAGMPFTNFVDTLYNLRVQYKTHQFFSKFLKLLLNSLTGRFGIKLEMNETKCVDTLVEVQKLAEHHLILELIPFNTKFIVKYNKQNTILKGPNTSKNLESSYLQNSLLDLNLKSAVQVAAAITAYARIEMHNYKKIYQNELYYSDTDSLFCSKPLDSKFISNTELGKFKLENHIKEAFFIAPKIYACKYINNNVVIKCKGIPSQLLSYSDIVKLYKNFVIEKLHTSFFRQKFNSLNPKTNTGSFFLQGYLQKRVKKYSILHNWVDTAPLHINE